MTFTRSRYTIHLDDGSAHEVEVTHQDMLRAEQQAHRMGLPGLADAPMTHSSLWAWAALKRMKVLDAKPVEFLNVRLVAMEKVRELDDDGEPLRDDDGELVGDPAVDPTQPDPATDSP